MNKPEIDPVPLSKRRLGVIVVEPLPVVRAGLTLLISACPDMEVLAACGEAEAGFDALRRVRRSHVVLLVGLGLAGERDSFSFIRAVRERYPMHAILGCGANADPAHVSRALFMGADGFVDKNVDPEEFLQAIRRAANHEVVLSGPPPIAVGEIANGIERRRDVEIRLTEREREVLSVAAEGLTAREIGNRLGVRERTVTTHLARIYGKLGVGSRLAAIRLAAQSGLVTAGRPE